MSRTRDSMSAIRRSEQSALLERRAQRFHELKRGLDQLEYFCKGTVLKRMMKCGKAGCACASDPARRHGPYFELTYKANGKTVNVKLSPEAAPLYKAASLQYRTASAAEGLDEGKDSLFDVLERLVGGKLRPVRPAEVRVRESGRELLATEFSGGLGC